MSTEWKQLPRSERVVVGNIEFDVWRQGQTARYTVLNRATGEYVACGERDTIEQCKEQLDRHVRAAEFATRPWGN